MFFAIELRSSGDFWLTQMRRPWYHPVRLSRRRSSAAEQGTHKPSVGGSNPPVVTQRLQEHVMSQPASSERLVRAMQQRLLRAFHADFLVPPQRLIVGFSGGPDSLAM